MEPNNDSKTPQTIAPEPTPVVMTSAGLPQASAAQQATSGVKPNNTNYAAAVFFTLLIVGFTFHLPSLLYLPVLFFCIAAGIIFFRDTLSARKTPSYVPPPGGVPGSPNPAVKKKRSPLMTLLLIIFGAIGGAIILFVGFIIFAVIMLGASGV